VNFVKQSLEVLRDCWKTRFCHCKYKYWNY